MGNISKELIENYRKIVLPFVSNRLYKTNFEGQGETDKTEFEQDFNEILNLAISALNPSDDCISRELLKKDIDAQISDFNELNKKGEPYKEFKDIRAILFGLFIGKNLIDNAQTVEPRIEYGADGQPYKLSMTNGKEYERPQGEWLEYNATGKKQYMCSKCSMKEKNPKIARYCYWCGAKMKGGAE